MSVRAELAAEIMAHHKLTATEANEVVKHIINSIAKRIRTNSHTMVRGLGTWRAHTSPPRIKYHPMTQIPIQVPPKRRVRFKASAALTEG